MINAALKKEKNCGNWIVKNILAFLTTEKKLFVLLTIKLASSQLDASWSGCLALFLCKNYWCNV